MILPVALLAYVIGALPLGYWAVRRLSGRDPRWASAYNLGLESALDVLGAGAVAAAFLLDLLKGLAAVSLARTTGLLGAVLAAGAVYFGHLTGLPGHPAPRARGAGVLFGSLGGLAVAGLPLPYIVPALAASAAVYAATGYGSLAALTLPAVLAIAALAAPVPPATKALLWLLPVLAGGRYKENLGRILDGIEPRLGRPLPLPSARQVVCAFLIHPMSVDDLWQSLRFRWLRPLVQSRVVPLTWVQALAERFNPMKVGELTGVRTGDGRQICCYLLSTPLLPEQIVARPELAVRRAIQAARLARELGATTIGLGAFWSVVGDKGLVVQQAVPEIHVTNGGALTAGTVRAAVPRILERFAAGGRDLRQVTAAVVGATGVVAFGIARQIAPLVGALILIARDRQRLERSAALLQRAHPGVQIIPTTDIAQIKCAELIFTATSDPGAVIFPEHVREGAWIYDDGRPADVHPAVRQVPGVRVIPGGVVRPPGQMRGNLDLHFGDGTVPACLAETMILAAEEAWERKSLGSQTRLEDIQFYLQKAHDLGFEILG
ncbi:MAG: glycerol-3-phosphate acyltransferase [Armatimonadota bacterium]|nr:glycerol-3-phosphate acyltransferase [Armatimonadota bacterium]MDR7464249.1 glycerol-3-phosphate acyltransferase [Armatimonadota bacterium]MDR7470844.1 glycerol-3-phosphate acyltransferase [Armatimonadota bacterium]MDR7474524.1 glycerol-3-phosphate acyltransferase [Armatimonadota bacterium]MDR7540103.1 glycerol-3-phosphate acyltransferase [Armatimonadota bacterium]